jgi:membrane fusion protein
LGGEASASLPNFLCSKMSDKNLFRSEAIDAHRPRLEGTVVLRSSPVWVWLTLTVAAFVAGMVALMVWGEYTRRVAVAGYLIPQGGVLRIFSALPGRVEELPVAEGQTVAAGQVLMRVVDERPDALGGDARRTVMQKAQSRQTSMAISAKQQITLYAHQKEGVERRLAALDNELLLLNQEQETQLKRRQMAETTLKRWQQMAGDQYVSDNAVQEKLELLTEQQARLQALARGRATLLKEQASLRTELEALPLREAAQAQEMSRSRSQLDQELIELAARRELVITSPRAGRVAGLTAKPGQAVGTERTVMTILPEDMVVDGAKDAGRAGKPPADLLEAHLFVPSRDAGFVRKGQSVLIRYSAYPYQKFGHHKAEVIEVSQTPLLPSELPYPVAGVGSSAAAGSMAGLAALSAQSSAGSEPVYRVRVRLSSGSIQAYGQPQPLQSGMQLEADIMLDTRTLVEWVLEPIYSIRGKYFP